MLHLAAVDIAAEHGFGAVTAGLVSERAEVSPRTFFNYFECLEDAVIGWEPARGEALARALERVPPELSSFEALTQVMLQMYVEFARDSEATRRRLRVIDGTPRLQAHVAGRFVEVEARLVAGVERREMFRGEDAPSASVLVASVLAVCRVGVLDWCQEGGHQPLVDRVARNLRQLSAGFGACSSNRHAVSARA